MLMPFGRSDAGLGSLSDYRASVIQRMRTLSRAQYGVSTIICWRSHASSAGGDRGARQGEFCAAQALQPTYDPYGHIGHPPAQQWYCRRRASFPRLVEKLGTLMLARDHCGRSEQEIKCYLGAQATVRLREPAANVRSGAHSRFRSDIAPGPKSAGHLPQLETRQAVNRDGFSRINRRPISSDVLVLLHSEFDRLNPWSK